MTIIKTVTLAHRELELFPAESTPVTLQFSVCTPTSLAGVMALDLDGVVYSMRFSWNGRMSSVPGIRGHNLRPTAVYDMQCRVRAILAQWVHTHLLESQGQGATGPCNLASAQYVSRLINKGHLRMPCIKARAAIPHLCKGTIVNRANVPQDELSRMEAAVETINTIARAFVAAHGLLTFGFRDFIRACYGADATDHHEPADLLAA